MHASPLFFLNLYTMCKSFYTQDDEIFLVFFLEAIQLQEYLNRENEIRYRLGESLANKKKLSMRDFYPEFKFEGTYTNAFLDKTWKLQLPFYDTLIVPIAPYKKKPFESLYDCHIEMMLELYKKGKILFILGAYPLHFKGLDHLDPILDLKPPVLTMRKSAYHILYTGLHLLQQRSMNFKELCTTDEYIGLAEQLKKISLKGYGRAVPLDKQVWTRLGDLNLYGYGELVSKLLKIKQSYHFAYSTFMLHRILVELENLSIDGIMSLDKEDFNWAAVASRFKNIDKDIDVFPCDVGQLLIKELRLMRVDNLGIDKVLEISKNTAKARRALLELDRAVAILQMDKIIDRARALESIWSDSNEIIDSMLRKAKLASLSFLVSVGIVGGMVGSIGGSTGIIASIVGSVTSSLPIAKRVSESLVKLKKPAHTLAIFDLKKNLKS